MTQNAVERFVRRTGHVLVFQTKVKNKLCELVVINTENQSLSLHGAVKSNWFQLSLHI